MEGNSVAIVFATGPYEAHMAQAVNVVCDHCVGTAVSVWYMLWNSVHSSYLCLICGADLHVRNTSNRANTGAWQLS